jgi:hypothetical protein
MIMDNTAQNQVQTFPVQPQQSMPQQPVMPAVPVQQLPHVPVLQPQVESISEPLATDLQPSAAVPATPVSLPHREAGPGFGKMSEFITPTEAAPVLSLEVKAAGVEVAPDTEKPEIPAEVQQMGVQPAKAAVPVQPVTGSSVEYITNAPFSPEEAQKFEKSARASDSVRWLATFLLRQLKKVTLFKN